MLFTLTINSYATITLVWLFLVSTSLNSLSNISRLKSRKSPISKIQDATPGIEPRTRSSASHELKHSTTWTRDMYTTQWNIPCVKKKKNEIWLWIIMKEYLTIDYQGPGVWLKMRLVFLRTNFKFCLEPWTRGLRCAGKSSLLVWSFTILSDWTSQPITIILWIRRTKIRMSYQGHRERTKFS